MRSNSRLKKGVERLFRAKQRRRMELARLPIEEKIRILLGMQKLVGGLRPAARGMKRRAWAIRS